LCITSCVKVVLKHEVVLIGGDLESGEEVAWLKIGVELNVIGLVLVCFMFSFAGELMVAKKNARLLPFGQIE
jgi:hypothetical protein